MTISLSDYADKYPFARLERNNGIIEVALHTKGQSMLWGEAVHRQLSDLFVDIGRDPENLALVLTGTGNEFCARFDPDSWRGYKTQTPDGFYKIHSEGRKLLTAFLDLEIPTVSAINGPATLHGELPLMADVVIATKTVVFQDRHYIDGKVPGDGAHIVWPALLGPNLGRSFLLTGSVLEVARARDLGLVFEVVEQERLLVRAREIAIGLSAAPGLTARYSRLLLTQELRKAFAAELSHGLILEGAAMCSTPGRPVALALTRAADNGGVA